MYTKRHYNYWTTIIWSGKGLLLGAATALAALLIYRVIGTGCFFVPWQPVLLVGTALAFYLGFKNNASYDRLWEARKIWGAILNGSRSFAASVTGFVTNLHTAERISEEELHNIRRRLIFRHLAWVTSLRFQLRTPREWEHTNEKVTRNFPNFNTPEFNTLLDDELRKFIPEHEIQQLDGKSNRATQTLAMQTLDLRALREQGLIDDFRHMELQKLISAMYDEQGKSERIKNFPLPRQYASVPLMLIKLISILLPFAMIREFETVGPVYVWMAVPFNAIVTWVFVLMEMIGDYSENPFEGTYNDIPISAISRTIEIDLKEMLGESDIPPAMQPVDGMLL